MPTAISPNFTLALSSLVRFDLRDQRQDAALAFVVGAHDEEDELDRDDQRDRPEDERDDAEDVLFGRLDRAVVGGEEGLQRVERAGADVAEDDAERAEGQRRHAELATRSRGREEEVAIGRNLAMGEGVDEHGAHVVGPVEDLRVGEAQGAQAGRAWAWSRLRSTACSAAVRWWRRLSVSTTKPSSGQKKSTR